MSFLNEILDAAHKVDMELITQQIPALDHKLDVCRNGLLTYFQDSYIRFKKRPNSNGLLQDEITNSIETLNLLKEKSDDMLKHNRKEINQKFIEQSTELQKLDCELEVVKNIHNILKLLSEVDQEIKQKHYLRSAEIVRKLKELSKRVPSSLNVKKQLCTVIVPETENKLRTTLGAIVEDNIKIEKSFEGEISLKIKIFNDELGIALAALYKIDDFCPNLKSLTKDLWEFIFVPIIENTVKVDQIIDNPYIVLTVKQQNYLSDKYNYLPVFHNLLTFLDFFEKNFKFQLCKSLTTIEYISVDLRENLIELLIKKCLKNTIPSTETELEQYGEVIEATKKLEAQLIDSKVFETGTTSLSDYVSNVDELFIHNKCKEYLNKAQTIMKKNLHNAISVGVPYDEEKPLSETQNIFPKCSISKHLLELIKFCESILDKAISSSIKYRMPLFKTVTKIIMTYQDHIMENNKQYLDTLPQQVALIYNNCMYVSYTLREWNKFYCENYEIKWDINIDNVLPFSINAINMLNNYIEKQIDIIKNTLNESGLEKVVLTEKDPKIEKAVRKCLRQHEVLRTVWFNILPRQVYDKNIGIMLNEMCKKLIELTVATQDISVDVAEDLVEIYKLVVNRGPKIFGKAEEICLFVPTWYKFNEVIFVLESSLVEIEGRWADGKGPLGLHMEINELHRLIKALFQDTNQRAKLLAYIK